MHKHYSVHFMKGTLPPGISSERYFLDSELGHQKGCCHQWCHDPAASRAHRPCQLPPQPHWQLASTSPRGGSSGSRCQGPQPHILQQPPPQPQPLILQQLPPQPQPSPPRPLRQRHCIHGAQKGPPAASTAPIGLASAPQLPPTPTAASSNPALSSAVSTQLEPSDTRPLPPAACGLFTSYSSGADPDPCGGSAWLLPPCFLPGPPVPWLTPRACPLTPQLVPVWEGLSSLTWLPGLRPSVLANHSGLCFPPRGPGLAGAGPCSAASPDILTEDDIYCSCLAKTLCHVPVPVTVGFYAPFGCRLHMMLDKITALMQQEAAQREAEELLRVRWRPRQVRGWGYPQLLWYLVFLQPVITEVHLRRKNVQFLFIRFSAWQYAGTDKLWAGLVTTLCEGIRHHYGALPFSVYSVLGNKPATSPSFCQREWHCRRRVCLGLLALLAALGIGVGLLYLSLSGRAPGHGAASGNLLRAFGGAATTLSGSGLIMAVYSVGKHLFVSQRKKIERLVSREKFGSQLGFMCEVKKEVELLTDFLCFLEIYQRRRLRIVLELTGLDTCYPERVVGVLNAINTLLSDSHAPFIFILVVDPSILAACLESASSMKGTADNGYHFLNRIVTLPFSVPVMGRRTKLQFLQDAVQSRDDLLYREITRKLRPQGGGVPGGEGAQLLGVETQAGAQHAQGRIDAEAARRIKEALLCLHDESDCLYEYVPDNVVAMRRIVNTVPITVRLLQQQQGNFSGPTPRQAVAWVVLANQWPCRLSWVLQCLEDRQQTGGGPEGRALLWDVFRDNSRELHTMTKELQNVLDLDGDPELFERFLGTDFPFTAAEAQSLLRCTVNLDHSIRRRMGLIRAVSALKPPSPPKSPAHGAPSEAKPASGHAALAAPAPGPAGEAPHPRGWAPGGKPRPVA